MNWKVGDIYYTPEGTMYSIIQDFDEWVSAINLTYNHPCTIDKVYLIPSNVYNSKLYKAMK